MALIRRTKRPSTQQSFRITNGATLSVGQYASIASASGNLETAADTAGDVPIGLVTGFDPPDEANGTTTGTAAAPFPEAIVDLQETIVADLSVTGVTGQDDKGKEVYVTGPDTFTLTPTTNIPAIGKIVRYHTGTIVDVLFYSMATIAAK